MDEVANIYAHSTSPVSQPFLVLPHLAHFLSVRHLLSFSYLSPIADTPPPRWDSVITDSTLKDERSDDEGSDDESSAQKKKRS